LHFLLQEKKAQPGDHIIRARGAWFGNRSISAEVDLEAGIYEVLPKIEASRNADVPDVPEVVTKLAESNPQKLRQIGLNYDIANAKGLVELTDEEEQKLDQQKKESAAEKKKKTEQDVKEKANFESWKQEEKAEYEAWKRERTVHGTRGESKEIAGRIETTEEGAKNDAKPNRTHSATTKDDVPSPSTVADDEVDVDAGPTRLTDEDESEAVPAPEPHVAEKKVQRSAARNSCDDGDIPNDDLAFHAHHPQSIFGDILPDSPVEKDKPDAPADNTPKPWNAVCVLGLRVYSQDPEINIKLVKPKDVEEGAILAVGGSTAAGATM
jgi:hypothetical protein